VARMAVLAAGWPESVPGTTVDRQCGSSQQSVHFAAAGLVSGQYDVAIAGGVEIMSAVPLGASASHPHLGHRASRRNCLTDQTSGRTVMEILAQPSPSCRPRRGAPVPLMYWIR
jgi:acetyl-CoA acetyltransferase